jgi:hypothetical protein
MRKKSRPMLLQFPLAAAEDHAACEWHEDHPPAVGPAIRAANGAEDSCGHIQQFAPAKKLHVQCPSELYGMFCPCWRSLPAPSTHTIHLYGPAVRCTRFVVLGPADSRF